jgi:hypothetical protein
MALKRRSVKEDVFWLKMPLSAFALSVAMSTAVYFYATYYSDDILRRESNLYTNYNLVSSQVFAIEEAEQIIISNIDRFKKMVENQVMSEEDRVSLLAEIGSIRKKYKLFPVIVSVSEQEKTVLAYPDNVESPEEEVSLLRSELKVQLPLLHEEDLTRFLYDLMRPGRLLVNNRCVITDLPLAQSDLLDVIPHQQAACDFYWYTLRSEPYTFEGLEYE